MLVYKGKKSYDLCYVTNRPYFLLLSMVCKKNKKLKSVCGDLPVIVDSVGVHHQACLRKWKEKQLSRNWFK